MPIPNNTRVVLKYNDFFSLSSSAGVATCNFSGNSLYDPDITFTGHQPYYYDRYSALYQYYTVIGSRTKFTFATNAGSATGIQAGLASVYQNPFPSTAAGLR
jgi:hypothetical protein